MSVTDDQIRQALKRFTDAPVQALVATVEAIDEENWTITAKPIGQAKLFNVRLKASVDSIKEGVIEVPEQGSSVLIGLIGNNEETAYVIKYSQVKKVVIASPCELHNLRAELEKERSRIDKIIDALTNSATGAQDGGATYKANIALSIAGLPKADYSDALLNNS